MKVLGLTAILAACNFQSTREPGADVDASPGNSGADAAVDSAASPDVATPMPDAQSCFGVGILKVCLQVQPAGSINLPGLVNPIDTTASANCDQVVAQQGGPALCVIAATNVTVIGGMIATGTRPLVVIATDTITVNSSARIDVSSLTGPGSRRGAGSNPTDCSRSDKGRNDSGGAGGGGGGSFGTVGGKGGTGDLNNSDPPGTTATGGNPGAAASSPTVLRGGCSGGGGGEGTASDQGTGGAAGDGGGAVYLIAGNRITINGDIFASGGGGRVTGAPGGRQEGGGGGGSGGMIVLDAPMIQVQGRVAANGGAGGGGGGNVGGTSGGDGSTLLWNQRAAAGVGDQVTQPTGPPTLAGNGAQGTAANLTTNLDGSSSDLGAGGGAGGLGLIWTYGTLNGGAQMSPAPNQR